MVNKRLKIISMTNKVPNPTIKLAILVFATLGQLMGVVQCCGSIFKDHLGTTTSDLVIKEGDPMEINCTLFADQVQVGGQKINISSSMLTIKLNGARLQKLRTLDSSTAQYKVNKTAMKDSGFYICYIDYGLIDPKVQFICATHVRIAQPPRDIPAENFQCIGRDLKDITCSWNPPNYNIPTNYTLHMVLPGNITYSTCPHPGPVKNSCTFTTSDSPPYRISPTKLWFALESHNDFGYNWQTFEIDHYSHVIPGPALDFKVFDIGPTYSSVSWQPPRSIQYDNFLEKLLVYELTLTSNDTSTYEDSNNSKQFSPTFNMQILPTDTQVNLTSLNPFTNYTLTIRCRIKTAIGDDMWSEERTIELETKPDVPYRYPEIYPGGLEIIERGDSKRDVILYINRVSELYKNAPGFGYALSMDPLPPNLSENSSAHSITHNVYLHRLTDLDPQISYKLTIRSRNELGYSTGSSQITIPSRNNALPQIDEVFAIDWADGNYSIYWTPLKKDDSIDYFNLFWCPNFRANSLCTRPISSYTVDKSYGYFTLVLPRAQSFNFGVSAISSTEKQSVGIKWVACLESAGSSHVRDRFKKFELVATGPKSVEIAWELDCPALNLFINHYEIHYCKSIDKSCSSEKVVNATRETKKMVIAGLESNTLYSFTITACTNRAEELKSIAKLVETKLDLFTLIIMASAIICAIIFTLTIVYCLFVCAMKKRKDQKELKKAVKDNWIPKIPSRLKGDANILLNPLCHETPTILNEYENKEYMNADTASTNTTNHHQHDDNQMAMTNIDDHLRTKDMNNLISTISSHPNGIVNGNGNGLIGCDINQDGQTTKNTSPPRTLRKSSDPGRHHTDSGDSGYGTRENNPYYEASGILQNITDDSYIGMDGASSLKSLSETDLSLYNNSNHYNGYISDFTKEDESSHAYVFE